MVGTKIICGKIERQTSKYFLRTEKNISGKKLHTKLGGLDTHKNFLNMVIESLQKAELIYKSPKLEKTEASKTNEILKWVKNIVSCNDCCFLVRLLFLAMIKCALQNL